MRDMASGSPMPTTMRPDGVSTLASSENARSSSAMK